jgi:pimeloyl-ACP methyl ester carboxylesterase
MVQTARRTMRSGSSVIACLALIIVLIPRTPLAADGAARSADGVSIRYQVEGEGEPALVFVHCWACERQFWDQQVEHFKARYSVVTLDLGGHGASGTARQDWTISAFARDVLAVIGGLELARVVLIGHSMGGPVILEVARRIPDRVVGLVPVDTLLDVEQMMPPKEQEAMLVELRADFPGATGRFMRQHLFAPSTDPKLIEEIVRGAAAMPPDIAISAIEHATAYDARPALKEIEAPIRAINADKYPTNLEAARRYAPQFDAVIIEGVGHYPMLEAPDRFNALLEDVLRDFAG